MLDGRVAGTSAGNSEAEVTNLADLSLVPSDLGFDSQRFPKFRDIQLEAVEWTLDVFQEKGKRFVAPCLPQGAGKSLYAETIHKLTGWRMGVLTAYHGLEKQYMDDFERCGLVDIRGRSNYSCLDYEGLDCKDGEELGCQLGVPGGCSYGVAKLKAKNNPSFVTNYDYWMNVNDRADGLDNENYLIDILVLDEAHSARAKLASYISCRLYESELRRFGEWPNGEELKEWSQFAKEARLSVEAEIRTAGMEIVHLGKKVEPKQLGELSRLRSLSSRLKRIAMSSGDDWIVEEEIGGKYGRLWKFDSTFPGKYAEQYLFCGVPRVIAMSATLKPKTMWQLGVKSSEFEFKAWRRIFPPNRNPIYLVNCPTGRANKKGDPTYVQVDKHTSQDDMGRLIDWMGEEIIKPRLDRKGMIQTTSYDRQELVMDVSAYSKHMIGNVRNPDDDEEGAEGVARKFRAASPPRILVSPSFTTGYDFKGDQCEYIILIKVPFEPMVSKVAKAIEARDPEYGPFNAMQTTEQSGLRGMRFEMDRLELFLICGHFRWFIYQYAHLGQEWFIKSVRKVVKVPPPPPRLWKDKSR